MKRVVTILIALFSLSLAACGKQLGAAPAAAQQKPAVTKAQQVERGKFLVTIGGCNDCHTPFKMGPNGPEPDMNRMLSGHPEDLIMPPPPKAQGPWIMAASATNTAWAGPWGISYTKNLTPDELTGIGIWTEEMFIKTIRTGRHWGVSRPILPPMPWQNLNALPDEDLKAVFAYLKSIKPIKNQVPDAVLAPPPPAVSAAS
jgi:hypothetical protein